MEENEIGDVVEVLVVLYYYSVSVTAARAYQPPLESTAQLTLYWSWSACLVVTHIPLWYANVL